MYNLEAMKICDITKLAECHVNCETYRSRLAAGDTRRHALRPARVVYRPLVTTTARALEIMSVPVNPETCRYHKAGLAYAKEILNEGGLEC